MLRRLLEASTGARGPAADSSNSSLPPVTPALPTSPAATIAASTPASSRAAAAAAAAASLGPTGQQHPFNSTLYLPENDELEYSILAAFSDMETVFLACISTLLPLIVALGIAFGIRHVWRYRDRWSSTSWYRGVCSRDNTAESLHHRPQTIMQPTQILSAQDLVNGIDGPRYICDSSAAMEEVALAPGAADYSSPGCHMSKNANGNIITLTLKNNHLIVETEERAVTMEDTRNRNYQDNGCSVIVEAPPGYQNEPSDSNPQGSSDDVTSQITDQQALVHREEIPEDRSSAFDNAKLFGSTNTGLSQSDLSICSGVSVNPSYRYGNQLEYEAGHYGYPMYDAGVGGGDSSPSRRLDLGASSKWVEFDKSPDTEKTLLEDSKTPSLEKESSENVSTPERRSSSSNNNNNNNSSLQQQQQQQQQNNSVLSNGASQQQKLNEINSLSAKPVITGAILKDEASLQEDTFQEQQRKLGNGTLTPEHRRDDVIPDKSSRMEQNEVVTRPEGSTFVPSHKRSGSIPPRLIEESIEIERKKTLDIYSQIKTSTKSILPGLSPKFELLQNEVSPVDDKES